MTNEELSKAHEDLSRAYRRLGTMNERLEKLRGAAVEVRELEEQRKSLLETIDELEKRVFTKGGSNESVRSATR